jgi:hypothetical protein
MTAQDFSPTELGRRSAESALQKMSLAGSFRALHETANARCRKGQSGAYAAATRDNLRKQAKLLYGVYCLPAEEFDELHPKSK